MFFRSSKKAAAAEGAKASPSGGDDITFTVATAPRGEPKWLLKLASDATALDAMKAVMAAGGPAPELQRLAFRGHLFAHHEALRGVVPNDSMVMLQAVPRTSPVRAPSDSYIIDIDALL